MTSKIDLYYFLYNFKKTDIYHLKALKYLEKNLPDEFTNSDSEWVKIYKGLKESYDRIDIPFYCSEDEKDAESLCYKMCAEYFLPNVNEFKLVENFTCDDLKKECSLGKPVILYVKNAGIYTNGLAFIGTPRGDHPIVLVGMEDDNFIFNDPFGNMMFGYTEGPSNGEGVSMNPDSLKRRWSGKAVVFDDLPLDKS